MPDLDPVVRNPAIPSSEPAVRSPALLGSEPELLQLACVDAGGRSVALDVRQVREIVRDLEATPLPDAPPLLEGVVDLGGRLLPLVDLGLALGAGATEPGAGARIAVVEADGLAFALRVGAALEVIEVEPSRLAEAPDATGASAVRGLVQRPGAAPLALVGVAELAARVRRSGIEADPERGRERDPKRDRERSGARLAHARNESEVTRGKAT